MIVWMNGDSIALSPHCCDGRTLRHQDRHNNKEILLGVLHVALGALWVWMP
jgi:hypothetical protein